MASLSTAQLGTIQSDMWFRGLPSDLAQWLVSAGVLRSLRPSQHLFFRGDPADGLYAVLAGTLRVSGITANGKEALLTLLDPPVWFGELGLFDGLPRAHDIQADGEVVVLHLPLQVLQQQLELLPSWWPHFGRLMSYKTRLLMANHEGLTLTTQEGLLARRLLWIARSSESGFNREKIVVKISQDTLAQLLSMSRQTINRLLKSLQGKGALKLGYCEVRIVDFEKLVNLAELSSIDRKMLRHLQEEAWNGDELPLSR